MQAINHYVIVEKIKEEAKKSNGLLLVEKHQDEIRYKKGKVISFGNLVEGLNENDLIYYDKHAGYQIEHEETIYWVIKVSDIVVVL